MKSARAIPFLFFLLIVASFGLPIAAQAPATGASDAQAVWNALAKPPFDSSKIASVTNLVIERDRIHITLASGTLHFTQPVNGVVFGAVFHGSGQLQMTAPNPRESQQLALFTKDREALKVEFDEAVFSFTDRTFDEISAKVTWGSAASSNEDLYASRIQQNEDLGAAFLPRLFKSVMATDRTKSALFLADVKTKEYGWMDATYDSAEPEEIKVGRWADVGPVKIFDIWMSFPAGGRSASEAFDVPLAKADYVIHTYDMDVNIGNNTEMTTTAKLTIETRWPGERVLLFGLNSNLRVDKVTDSQGTSLTIIEAKETKDRYQSYGDYVAIVMPNSLAAGQTQVITFHYAGKRVIRQVGPGNYFADSFGWYPSRIASNTAGDEFAGRYDFHLSFRCAKKYTLVATGNKVSDTTDGNTRVTEWKNDVPLTVAGFAFGDYKLVTEKVGDIQVQVFANTVPDDNMEELQRLADTPGVGVAVGNLSPVGFAPKIATEMGNSIRTFQVYFGPYPYKQLAVANIPFGYGQGWPGLIYLSVFTFLDDTQIHGIFGRVDPRQTQFFRAHETSHQWWGHRVAWKSYHDQWLSEGFAQFSGNLYTQFRNGQKDYLTRLRADKQGLLTRDLHNRVIDSVGPAWMGYRTTSSLGPGDTGTIIYNKGGYALTMLRMMMADGTKPTLEAQDARFIAMMHDFTKTFDNKAASTEDFKAIAEKYMTPGMDVDHNHKLDWFFDQYVYGTGIPHYDFHYQVTDAGGGKWNVTGSLRRTGVPDDWKDVLPLFTERNGQMVRIGLLTSRKPEEPISFTLPMNPGKLQLNSNEELLAEIKQ
jgi:hypothetical protein